MPEPKKLQLHGWHVALDAEFRVSNGFLLPWSYSGAERGSFDCPAAGLLDLSNCGRLELVGEDRRRFLGGLVTCAVSDLEQDRGGYGFVTSIKGKVLADVVVSSFADRLFLLLPPGRSTPIEEHLHKYIVADRVEVLPLGDLLPFALVGEGIKERLPAGVWPRRAWGCGMMELLGTQVPVSRHERLGVPGLIVWLSSSIVEQVIAEWVEQLELEPVGRQAMERLRVEVGLPAFGVDYDHRHLPQESGIEAVDFTKGCYLGQEVIARLHYRGQVPKVVRRLVSSGGTGDDSGSSGDGSLELPTELVFEGRKAGVLTTAVRYPGGAWAGLGMVQRRAAQAGTELLVGDFATENDREQGSGLVRARVEEL